MKVVNVRVDELIHILKKYWDKKIEFVDVSITEEENRISINPSPEFGEEDPNDLNNLIA